MLRRKTSKVCTGYLAESSCCLAFALAASSCCAPFCTSASSRSWLCSAALHHVLICGTNHTQNNPFAPLQCPFAAVVRVQMSGRVCG